MSKAQLPDLKKYMDRRMLVKLNGNRSVLGVLRGFDQFMNLVLDDTVEEKTGEACGMVVIRGSSVSMMEVQERVD